MTVEHIPEIVDIWNENAPFLTTNGKLHSVETLTGWYRGKGEIQHEMYTLKKGSDIAGF